MRTLLLTSLQCKRLAFIGSPSIQGLLLKKVRYLRAGILSRDSLILVSLRSLCLVREISSHHCAFISTFHSLEQAVASWLEGPFTTLISSNSKCAFSIDKRAWYLAAHLRQKMIGRKALLSLTPRAYLRSRKRRRTKARKEKNMRKRASNSVKTL